MRTGGARRTADHAARTHQASGSNRGASYRSCCSGEAPGLARGSGFLADGRYQARCSCRFQ